MGNLDLNLYEQERLSEVYSALYPGYRVKIFLNPTSPELCGRPREVGASSVGALIGVLGDGLEFFTLGVDSALGEKCFIVDVPKPSEGREKPTSSDSVLEQRATQKSLKATISQLLMRFPLLYESLKQIYFGSKPVNPLILDILTTSISF